MCNQYGKIVCEFVECCFSDLCVLTERSTEVVVIATARTRGHIRSREFSATTAIHAPGATSASLSTHRDRLPLRELLTHLGAVITYSKSATAATKLTTTVTIGRQHSPKTSPCPTSFNLR